MKLELVYKNNLLSHIIYNESDMEVKFWDNNNSWGWGNTQIIVIVNNVKTRFNQKPKTFTRNGPSFIIIPPHSSYEYGLDLHKNNWESNLIPKYSDKEEIEIYSKITIHESKESNEAGVFIGQLKSNTIKIHSSNTSLIEFFFSV
ncbi:hypothetical protein [Flavobacterium cellulosilyticum]|uniref:Uncharacterized protein n=1 Tax=Flavobacterium cellulosilyticum TaxID=2541731 RepID=A0A4R5CCJ5_9FLAO|nr:hypothetical protein [Flavobacterium cellulosilyticum]TDD96000.1 hypothetical protein E0F76_12895 [Flavobacterium cellulosilyticum]